MATWLRFHGEEYRLNVTAAVNESKTLRAYRSRIAAAVLDGREVGEAAAQRLVERLVVAAFSGIARDFEEAVSPRVRRLFALRDEAAARYERVIDVFKSGSQVQGLPAELEPARIAALMDEVERGLGDLEAHANRNALQDNINRPRAAETVEEVMARAEHPHDDVEVQETVDPDLELGDPPPRKPRRRRRKKKATETGEGSGEPTEGDVVPAEGDVGPDEEDIGPRPDEINRLRYAEQKRWAPEDKALRARVQAAADGLIKAGLLPPGAKVHLVYTQAWSRGVEAQLARFEALDPVFLGKGYEVQIELNGRRFRSDGIHFVGERRYQFLESKEPYTWGGDAIALIDDPTIRGEGVAYNSLGGLRKLRDMLHRDAAIATELRGNGCAGFRYETGAEKLDLFLAAEIGRMRKEKVAGADLLSAPGPIGE